MRVLVTGGGGFIASWIIKHLLNEGIEVRSLDLTNSPKIASLILGSAASQVDWRAGDISNAEDVERAATDCDLIIHLAAILTPDCAADPHRGCNIVLGGTINVFEAARKLGHKQVLYMSSAGVFGPDQGHTPEPTTLYGAYKLAGEGVARAYFADHGIASAGFRPLVVYGPGRETGLTAAPSLACKAAANDEAFTIGFFRSDRFYIRRRRGHRVPRRDETATERCAAVQHRVRSKVCCRVCCRSHASVRSDDISRGPYPASCS